MLPRSALEPIRRVTQAFVNSGYSGEWIHSHRHDFGGLHQRFSAAAGDALRLPKVPAGPPPATILQNEYLNSVFWKMHGQGPVFPVNADSLEFISLPCGFLERLKIGIRDAKKRVVFSSLYMGVEPECKDLVACMRSALLAKPELEIIILSDFLRGTRGIRRSQDSLTMLFPLQKEFPKNVKLLFFHTPLLSGVWKALIPERLAEVSGVQHIKAYVFDDDTIISGANLSTQYFTNRQDRYVSIHNEPALAEFFSRIIAAIGTFSYQPNKEGVLELPAGVASPFVHPDRFQEFAAVQLKPLLAPNDVTIERLKTADTWIFPLLQMDSFGIQQDEEAITEFLTHTPENSELHLTTPYFNLTPHYIKVLLNNKSHTRLVTAAPEANGFYTASGAAGSIPAAYTHVERQFWDVLKASEQVNRIELYEWLQPGWTYHAKGFWYSSERDGLPSVTTIGSSNLGVRSARRDLEAQLFILTENNELRNKLAIDCKQFFNPKVLSRVSDATFTPAARGVPMWIRWCSDVIRAFL